MYSLEALYNENALSSRLSFLCVPLSKARKEWNLIWKQWKVPKKRLWGLKKLGVENWIAHKVAYWGDCYQKVATKSIVKRAISKEILIKRGLISISDYYQKVAHI